MTLPNDAGSLRTRVFYALETAILNGEYTDGSALNEIKISRSLGVSRTPVREALMQLELEGLVRNIPNKGAVVIGVSEKDIEDIYAIRSRIEGLASRLSAENITEQELSELGQLVELQEFYLQKNNTDKLWELDGEFHKAIYDSSHSRPLTSTLSGFHNYVRHARVVSVKTQGRAEKSVAEHRAILEAIAAHDGERAEQLTAEHIGNAKANIVAGFAQQ